MEPTTSPFRYVNNPFGPLVGRPLDDEQVDIADINSEAFTACQRLVEDVAGGGYSAALTVYGDSGTGKTHLVGRVRRWLEQRPGKLFVFVRLETSPAGIWRHLRRCLALALLRTGANGKRAMEPLLQASQSGMASVADRDLSIVMEHLMDGLHVRDCGAWLRGEGLPDEALITLGLAAPRPDDDPEVTARHTVIALCELLRPGTVVFCMDQIEAIMSSPVDRDGPHAFGRLVSCLIEETRNAAVISCQQNSFMIMMEQILDGSAKSKVMGRRAPIQPLSWDQARRLIAARIGTVPELAAERAKHSACWPLIESEIQKVFLDDAAPARRVLSHCKDLFDVWQSGATEPVEPLDIALQKMLDERIKPQGKWETEAILANAMPLLLRSSGFDPPAYQIEICNEAHMTSLASKLRKISQSSNRKLIMLRDARMPPISKNAKVALLRLSALEQKGGRLVTVSQEAVEVLAALHRLLSDAKSGDLAHRGEPVSASEVEQWIAGHLPSALDPLIEAIGSLAPTAAEELTAALAALLAERKLVTLRDAALSLEVAPAVIEECAHRDPGQFGILGGSVPALFQPASAA
jgi:hypothetical protein